MGEKLTGLREKIDAVDDKVMALLRRRAELALEVGEVKKKSGGGFSRPEREAEILRRLGNAGGPLSKSAVRAIYREIISACLAAENPQTIGYLGPPHTFTHEAARRRFGSSASYEPSPTAKDAVHCAEKGLCDFAVVPLENSGQGTVGETFDALLDTELTVCGEIILRVRHNLLAASKFSPAQASRIIAHPQALAQCREWIARHAPRARTVAVESNAAAAQIVAEKGGRAAAIASRTAAEFYRLRSIATDIEDSPFNATRFLVVGRAAPGPSSDDKTSLIMSAHSKAGALHHLLEPFSRLGINMTKFESRPAHSRVWEYAFFVDADGHRDSKNMARALEEIRARAAFLKVLGSYPRAAEE